LCEGIVFSCSSKPGRNIENDVSIGFGRGKAQDCPDFVG
jgi:hypothetical protein